MHFENMYPCLDEEIKTNQMPSECSAYEAEVANIMAYREYVKQTWSHLGASSTLSALHDIVTKSISGEWFGNGRGKLFCWEEAANSLPMLFKKDLPPHQDKIHFVSTGSENVAKNVPGIGQDSEPACSGSF